MEASIRSYVEGAIKRLSHRMLLQETANRVRSMVWDSLLEEGARLYLVGCTMLQNSTPRIVFDKANELLSIVQTLSLVSARFVGTLRRRQPANNFEASRGSYVFGICGAGRMGCTNISGQGINLHPLLSDNIGVITAMTAMGIELAIIPGARLRCDPRPIGDGDHIITGRWEGGTSYASVAAIWSSSSLIVESMANYGSHRRLWLKVDGGPPAGVLVCCLYLPANSDVDWTAELAGLSRDLADLLRDGYTLSRLLILGDWNYQPFELSGVADPKGVRTAGWGNFVNQWPFTILNQSFGGAQQQIVHLQLRNRDVSVHRGSTRHGPSTGRCIDLALATQDIDGTMCTHNGVQCKGNSMCDLVLCTEMGGGDHFVSTIAVSRGPIPLVTASPRFPLGWQDESRWLEGFRQTNLLWDQLFRILQVDNAAWPTFRQATPTVQRWLADSSTWIQVILASLVRDSWVTPCARPDERPSKRQRMVTPNIAVGTEEHLERELRKQHDGGKVTSTLFHRCFKWLRNTLPQPQPCMKVDGVLASAQDTHAAWRTLVTSQGGNLEHVSWGRKQAVRDRLSQLILRARSQRGKGEFDDPITEREVMRVTDDWDKSPSLPADLIPRAAYGCKDSLFMKIAWQLMVWTGPGALAICPRLWKAAVLLGIHKKGDPLSVENFRLIFVRVQLALLQESILCARVLGKIRNYIRPCQTGYVRGIEDPHLFLYELASLRRQQGLALVFALADFKKAFPRTWREDLLSITSEGPRIHDGTFALLAEMMEPETVHIWLSGISCCEVTTGIPEGGTIGTTMYVLLPDSLVRHLEAEGHGVGLGMIIPQTWDGHVWSGRGSPILGLVQTVVGALRSNGDLPSQSMLTRWPDLEASCARALDIVAPRRAVATLHADDPVFLSSSDGALSALLSSVAVWAAEHDARLHVTKDKTVVMRTTAGDSATAESTLSFVGVQARSIEVTITTRKRWLGVLWPHDLHFMADLRNRLAAADGVFSILSSLVEHNVVPLPLAVVLFEGKIDSMLSVSRWLWIGTDGSTSVLNEQYAKWARSLLGAAPWRNAAVASSELGWSLDGSCRLLRDVALRRARMQKLSWQDLYRGMFEEASRQGCGWAAASSKALEAAEILDWSAWSGIERGGGDYTEYVVQKLQANSLGNWTALATRHNAQVPYLQISTSRGGYLRECLESALDWDVLLATRAHCRLRAGLITLRCRSGKRSSARLQNCIFCSCSTRNATVHVIGKCAAWSQWRSKVRALLEDASCAISADSLTMRILKTRPEESLYSAVALWSRDIDKSAKVFWKGRDLK